MQSRRKRKSRMGTDRIRRLRHGAAVCVRRLSAPGHLCWSQQVGCVAKTHREAERCVIASSTHPTGYQLISLRALRDLCGLIPPVLTPWVDPTWRTYTVATAAQIEANRRNAQKSTGPKTERGKDHAKLNAIKHGLTARTIMPVLPQEDPKELEDRTQQAIAAMKPRNPLEHDLVCRAVRLSGELDRAERVATAHLAHRVRMDARSGTDTVSAEELSRVHDLGSKLFFQAGIGPGYSDSIADDYPAVIVRRLEESAEGCRWMLARWAELRNVLDRKAAWSDPEIIRFLGLLGKRGIEAHFDPELNSLFHAFDALGHRVGHKFWKDRRDGLPLGYKGGFQFVPYREIAPPPSDETEALILIRSVIERHVGRLEELLAEHEEIEADEAAERYDRAALDCSPAFERHRRYQSARHRELMRTLETLRRMRNSECGTGNGEAEKADGKCRMADDRGQMADDRGQMADDRGQMADDECGWRMTDAR